MKIMDYVLIVFIAVFALGLLYYNTQQFDPLTSDNGKVIIRVDGDVYGEYPLNEDAEIMVGDKEGHYNMIVIESETVSMIESDCRDQICVHTAPITRQGQSIICLPNRVMVEVRLLKEDESEVEIDGISQ